MTPANEKDYIQDCNCEFCAAWRLSGKGNLPPPTTLPTDSAARKAIPIVTGVLDYFPAALAEVAKVSKAGNDKHNPGEPLHWARDKSADHIDSAVRHVLERGTLDPDSGLTVLAHAVWRLLAALQLELEAKGAPKARGAK
jgi:hypothetical protein